MAKDNKAGIIGLAAAGIATAAAVAGASYYYLGAKGAEKHRAKAKKWAKDMQKDVIKKAKKLKKIDQQALSVIIDESMKAYETAKDATVEDVQSAAAELKTGWEHVAKEVRRVMRDEKAKVAAKAGKEAVKSAAKKTVVVAKKAVKKNVAVLKKAAPAKKAVKPVAKKAPAKKPVAKKGKK